MSITRDEYNLRRPPRARQNVERLHVAEREAVRMEAVTGDPNWDHFNSYLESALKASERALAAEEEKLRNPYLVNDELIRLCKVNITRILTRIETLREVIALPKRIKEHGALARAEIADMAAGEGGRREKIR